MVSGKGSRLQHGADVVACELDGGSALLDLASSDYYRLNGTAAAVWDGIGEGLSAPQIAQRIVSEYDVDLEQCTADVDAIISALLDAGLVIVSD